MNYEMKTLSLRRCALLGLFGFGLLSPGAWAGISPLSTSQSARATYFPSEGDAVFITDASSAFEDFHGSAGLTGKGAPDNTASASSQFDLLFGAHAGVQDQISLNGNAINSLMGVIVPGAYQPYYNTSADMGFKFSTDEAVEVQISYSLWVDGLIDCDGRVNYSFSDITNNDDGDNLSRIDLRAFAGSDSEQGTFSMIVGPGDYSLNFSSSLRPVFDVDLASEVFDGQAGFDFAFSARTLPAPGWMGLMLAGFPAVSRRSRRSSH